MFAVGLGDGALSGYQEALFRVSYLPLIHKASVRKCCDRIFSGLVYNMRSGDILFVDTEV